MFHYTSIKTPFILEPFHKQNGGIIYIDPTNVVGVASVSEDVTDIMLAGGHHAMVKMDLQATVDKIIASIKRSMDDSKQPS
jgi:hypothetical protein